MLEGGALAAGVVPGHLQTTAKLPLSKVANSQMLRGVPCLCLNPAGMGSSTPAKGKKKKKELAVIYQRFKSTHKLFYELHPAAALRPGVLLTQTHTA